uniref:WD repeat-containing protein 47 n=1 Tax=Acrobeloides nanus TaxID=290746 RepID=A0A914E4U9_9BILA
MTVATTNIAFSLAERDILKAILEFLELRGFYITQLSLERETGVINGEFSEDVLFLRQLILDGQWDNALDFIEPLKEVPEFDLRAFRYLITKHKYFELLCIKQEPGPLQDNDFAVEEIVECLKDLEHICPTPEDYRHLCALLTLPKLSDHMDFRYWNPSSARMECFHKIFPLVADLLPDITPKKTPLEMHSCNERLIQLLTKGIFYEACIDFCQAQALGNKKAIENGPQFTRLLTNRPKLSSTDLSLVSWLDVVSREQFACPFQQKSLEFKLEPLKKPKLEAQWTEQILATPIKPGGQFPHTLMPNTKMKSVQKMTQSLIFPAMSASLAMESSMMTRTKRRLAAHPMSQSTSASIGFSIQDNQQPESEVMQQSHIINNMFENSELTKTSRPPGAANSISSSSLSMSVHSMPSSIGSMPSQPIMPSPIPPTSLPFDMSNCRRELDAIVRRNPPPSSSSKQSSLPPVPELSTPGSGPGNIEETQFDNPMTHSRLFQEFQSRLQYSIPNQVAPSPPPSNLQMGYPNAMPPQQYMPMDGFYPSPYGNEGEKSSNFPLPGHATVQMRKF